MVAGQEWREQIQNIQEYLYELQERAAGTCAVLMLSSPPLSLSVVI